MNTGEQGAFLGGGGRGTNNHPFVLCGMVRYPSRLSQRPTHIHTYTHTHTHTHIHTHTYVHILRPRRRRPPSSVSWRATYNTQRRPFRNHTSSPPTGGEKWRLNERAAHSNHHLFNHLVSHRRPLLKRSLCSPQPRRSPPVGGLHRRRPQVLPPLPRLCRRRLGDGRHVPRRSDYVRAP